MRELFGKEEFPRFKAIFSATRQSVKADFSSCGRRRGADGGSGDGSSRASSGTFRPSQASGWGPMLEKIPLKVREKLSLQPSIIKK